MGWLNEGMPSAPPRKRGFSNYECDIAKYRNYERDIAKYGASDFRETPLGI